MCSIKKLQRFSRPRLSGVRRLFLEAEDRLQFLPADRILGHFALLRALDRRRIREGFRKCGAQRSASGSWRAGGAIQPRPRTMLPAVSYAICWSCGSVKTSLRKGASGRPYSGAVALAASKLTSGTRYERAIVKAERDDWKP